jgi:hypothetical protein
METLAYSAALPFGDVQRGWIEVGVGLRLFESAPQADYLLHRPD